MKSVILYDVTSGVADMPAGAQVIAARCINGQTHVHVLCDPDKPTERRTFLTAQGDCTVPDTARSIGSVPTGQGAGMIHIFETTPKKSGTKKKTS